MAKVSANGKPFTSIKRLLRMTNNPSVDDGAPECTKRALVVGVSYLGLDSNIISHLPGTEQDVLRVAKALVETQNYQLENIRVLFNGYDDCYVPTKANILSGLAWLVKNCRPGDFRAFTFAGHGFDDTHNFDSDTNDRKVYDKNRPLLKNGNGRRTIDRHQALTYSREAIAPQDVRWLNSSRDSDSGSDSDSEDEPRNVPAATKSASQHPVMAHRITTRSLATPKGLKIDLNKLIFDTELNNAFADLPEDAVLTCLFDCCHSGRILSLPVKLGGGGYRSGKMDARLITAVRNMSLIAPSDGLTTGTSEGVGPTNNVAPLTINQQASLVNKLGLSHGLFIIKSTEKGRPKKSVVSVQYGLGDPYKGQAEGAQAPISSHQSTHDDRNDVDSEQLPKIEQQVNKIRARVLCWAGAHQRQSSQEVAMDSGKNSYGLFTKVRSGATYYAELQLIAAEAFCDAIQFTPPVARETRTPVTSKVISSDQKQTYRQIFVDVDLRMEAQLKELNESRQKIDPDARNIEQFPQLWSVHKLDKDLDQQFEM